MAIAQSLFDPPARSPIEGSTSWVSAVMFGELAIGLCVIAVALLGMLMLSGRMHLRRGIRVVLGCFIVLGAPVMALGLQQIVAPEDNVLIVDVVASEPAPVRPDLAPAPDPYAGASLRRD